MNAYILGVYATNVGKFPDKGPKDLTREAYLGSSPMRDWRTPT